MAPSKTANSKPSSAKLKKGLKTSGSSRLNSKSRISKQAKAPPSKQQKTKPAPAPVKKKRRVYTEKELGIPKLNMITPAGVALPKGKKKGKVFVDDQESMMTILSIVNATQEGQIESKIMKSRQMEEIREARRKEAEAKQEKRKLKLEEAKDSIRRQRKRRHDNRPGQSNSESDRMAVTINKPSSKKVSFV